MTSFVITLVIGSLAYVAVIQMFLQGKLLPSGVLRETPIVDYICYYVAGVLAKQSLTQPVHVYDAAAQLVIYNDLIKPCAAAKTLYCPYPPYFFLLMVPFVALSLNDSFMLFCLLGLAANLLAIYGLFKEFGWKYIFIGGIFVIGNFPTWQGFLLGNTSIFMFPALWLYTSLWRRNLPFASGFSMIPYLFKFQYMPLQTIPAIKRFGWKFIVAAALSLVGLVAVSVATLGWQNVIEFPRAMNQTYTFKTTDFENLRGQLAFIPHTEFLLTQTMSNVRIAFSILIGLWFFYFELPKFSKAGVEVDLPVLSLTVLASVVVSPYTYVHDFAMVLLPCVWIWLWVKQYADVVGPLLSQSLLVLTVGFPAISWCFVFGQGVFCKIQQKPFAVWSEVLIILILVAMYKVMRSKVQSVEFSD